MAEYEDSRGYVHFILLYTFSLAIFSILAILYNVAMRAFDLDRLGPDIASDLVLMLSAAFAFILDRKYPHFCIAITLYRRND